MKIVKATSGKLYPNKKQQQLINYNIDCCRFVKNNMIERHKKAYERRKEKITLYDMQKTVTKMKDYLPWLRQADSRSLAFACKEVENAYNLFYKKVSNYPKFHSKKGRQSYTTTYMPNHNIKKNKICLPKIGWVTVKGLKNISENFKICYATVIRETDNTYRICVTYKYTVELNQSLGININNIIGMDYKSNGLYVDSNGNSPKLPRWFYENQIKLARQERKLSKKKGSKKGEKRSSNWEKQHKRVLKIQRKIANQRKDALHKLSNKLVNMYDAIGIEDINLMSLMMCKNFQLGKSTTDNGFGMFRNFLNYKFKELNKIGLIKIDKYYPSSQLCSCCGFKNPKVKDLNIREWICDNCGKKHDRDINAAINIKNEAIRIINK